MCWFLGLAVSVPLEGIRALLIAEVTRFPGLHLRELSRLTNLAPSHAQYHLRVLEKTGFVRSAKEGANLRFYPTQATPIGPLARLDQGDRRLLGLLRNPPILRLMVLLVLDAPLTLAQLADASGTKPSTVLHHLRRLQESELVVRDVGEEIRWQLRNPSLVRRLLAEYEPPPRYVEGFLETWHRLGP